MRPGKTAIHWFVDRESCLNVDVLRYLVKLNPSAIVLEANDRIILQQNIVDITWNPLQRTMTHGLVATT